MNLELARCYERPLYSTRASIQSVGAACFGVCVPVCMCAAVKSVFGNISACVHSVIEAPGVIKTQTKRGLCLTLINTLLKWCSSCMQYTRAVVKSPHADYNIMLQDIKYFYSMYSPIIDREEQQLQPVFYKTSFCVRKPIEREGVYSSTCAASVRCIVRQTGEVMGCLRR